MGFELPGSSYRVSDDDAWRWRQAILLSLFALTTTPLAAVFSVGFAVLVAFFVVGSLVLGSPGWWIPAVLGVVGAVVIVGWAAANVRSREKSEGSYAPFTSTVFGDRDLKLGLAHESISVRYDRMRAVVSRFGFVAFVLDDGSRMFVSSRLAPANELHRFHRAAFLTQR